MHLQETSLLSCLSMRGIIAPKADRRISSLRLPILATGSRPRIGDERELSLLFMPTYLIPSRKAV